MYRAIYAKAMLAATGLEGDGKYTSKSAMYQAAYATLCGSPVGGSIRNFVWQVLRETSGLYRVDQNEFLDWLGDDWADSREFMRSKIGQVVAPDAAESTCSAGTTG
jgi:hypothetical protein